MVQAKTLQPGVNTHENVIFSCYGGFSNTGITSALACLEVAKELGLKKVAVGCLGALPISIEGVINKTRAAKKVITVDGCPSACAQKIVEKAGINLTRSIILSRDIGLEKKPLDEVIGSASEAMMDYFDPG